MFKKILIANRADIDCAAVDAVEAHVRAADVMPEPHRRTRAACGDRAAEH
ncbi:hypothetical protein [Piscinibacter koreensis]|uniref:Uncharacterized protein n=1 Tax=Piscinibacter koreensis TaxID=2742824 RepID=A0A7Y6NKJ9_9BURK|nr:hypothetical protein [Schlegelella koreensis]NUZ04796.1 hypothetical protein [Schlegelella koreensis]